MASIVDFPDFTEDYHLHSRNAVHSYDTVSSPHFLLRNRVVDVLHQQVNLAVQDGEITPLKIKNCAVKLSEALVRDRQVMELLQGCPPSPQKKTRAGARPVVRKLFERIGGSFEPLRCLTDTYANAVSSGDHQAHKRRRGAHAKETCSVMGHFRSAAFSLMFPNLLVDPKVVVDPNLNAAGALDNTVVHKKRYKTWDLDRLLNALLNQEGLSALLNQEGLSDEPLGRQAWHNGRAVELSQDLTEMYNSTQKVCSFLFDAQYPVEDRVLRCLFFPEMVKKGLDEVYGGRKATKRARSA